jgi:hypothetical protein
VPALSVSPVDSITEALARWQAGERVQVLRTELLDVLAQVPDPRDPRGVRYSLMALLAVAILATAAGMRSYAGFATWAANAPQDVLAQLGIRYRRPSEKTFRTVLSRLDAADLDRRLGDTSPRWPPRSPSPVTRCWWRWTARRCEGHAAPERPRSMWCRCSPITRG